MQSKKSLTSEAKRGENVYANVYFSFYLQRSFHLSFKINEFLWVSQHSLNITRTIVLFLFTIIAHSISQDTRTLLLSKISDTKYACVDSSCSPSTITFASNLIHCQKQCWVVPTIINNKRFFSFFVSFKLVNHKVYYYRNPPLSFNVQRMLRPDK
jgi:hypothetical protein